MGIKFYNPNLRPILRTSSGLVQIRYQSVITTSLIYPIMQAVVVHLFFATNSERWGNIGYFCTLSKNHKINSLGLVLQFDNHGLNSGR